MEGAGLAPHQLVVPLAHTDLELGAVYRRRLNFLLVQISVAEPEPGAGADRQRTGSATLVQRKETVTLRP